MRKIKLILKHIFLFCKDVPEAIGNQTLPFSYQSSISYTSAKFLQLTSAKHPTRAIKQKLLIEVAISIGKTVFPLHPVSLALLLVSSARMTTRLIPSVLGVTQTLLFFFPDLKHNSLIPYLSAVAVRITTRRRMDCCWRVSVCELVWAACVCGKEKQESSTPCCSVPGGESMWRKLLLFSSATELIF